MELNFYADHDRGITVARVDDVWHGIARNISKRFPHLSYGKIFQLLQKTGTPRTLVGKARCNMELDAYDVDTGIKIASYRVMQKYNSALTRLYARLMADIHKDFYLARDMVMKYSRSLDDQDKYIE